jgi:hypothetical protein
MLRQGKQRAQDDGPQVATRWWNKSSTHRPRSVLLQRDLFGKIFFPKHGAQEMSPAIKGIIANVNCNQTV